MNDLIKTENGNIMQFNKEQVELIKTTIAKNATDNELQLFLQVCKKTGLDPFSRQIYAIKRGGQMTIQTGIDGYRLTASRSNAYAGSDEPTFGYLETDRMKSRPNSATVTVYKIIQGIRCAFTSTGFWREYCPFEAKNLWKTMPHTMLAKCVEALSLRKAFPAELSDLRTVDEMQQADDDIAITEKVVENITNDYSGKKELLEYIIKASTMITSNYKSDEKTAFMRDIWGVSSYNELKLKNEKELSNLLERLQEMIRKNLLEKNKESL